MLTEDFAQAFQSGYNGTCRFLMSRGAPAEEAEEIAQAAWARGWEYRQQLKNPGLVSFWVNSIARNLFRARFRSPMIVPMEATTDPSYTMSLSRIELRELLDQCSGRDREMLEKTLEGYSAEEIAKTSGISSTGVRVRMLRLRQNLRHKLALVAA